MKTIDPESVRSHVQARYGQIAEGSGGCCGGTASSCCGSVENYDQQLGYTPEEVAAVPAGANLGLGCGNPTAIASIRPGETVVDLGSGAGFDCFLAARQLAGTGRVIGVDMTPAMIANARANARRGGYGNIEFRLGEIEALPVPNAAADLVISNCVINLSPEKSRVFAEAFRVLKPGGRLAIADIVAIRAVPAETQGQLDAICACVGGAPLLKDLQAWLHEAGFTRIEITTRDATRSLISQWTEDGHAGEFVVSALITAAKS